MKPIHHIKSFLIIIAVVLVMLIVVSVFDIILAVIYSRFYTSAVFAITFAVAGIFAGLFSYAFGIKQYKEFAGKARWLVTAMVTLAGFLFIFLIAPNEGGEYEIPFISYGIALIAGGLFVGWLKIDF